MPVDNLQKALATSTRDEIPSVDANLCPDGIGIESEKVAADGTRGIIGELEAGAARR